MSQPDRNPLLEEIDVDRILDRIEQMAAIGRLDTGGVTRLAFSREDLAARALLIEWMREAGLAVERDPVGNLFGTLSGAQPDAPIVATGSHIDTVTNAGKFDGVLGTLAAVECARVLSRHAKPTAFQVICFVMEESARFGGGYGFGSHVLAGYPIGGELSLRDAAGTTLAVAVQELKAWEDGRTLELTEDAASARTREDILAARRDFSRMRAFVELHVEQGAVLDPEGGSRGERAQKRIGSVTAVAAPTRLKVTFSGEQNHSGSTPMSLRRDALAAAAEAILAVERIAQQNADRGMVGTVGVIQVEPGAVNVIPGRAEIRIDLRGIHARVKREMTEAVLAEIEAIGKRRAVGVWTKQLSDEEPVSFSDRVVQAVEASCAELGTDALRLPSGAGHDAAHLARVVDAGMIFVPSLGGISHDPREASARQDIRLGTQVLLATLLRLAE